MPVADFLERARQNSSRMLEGSKSSLVSAISAGFHGGLDLSGRQLNTMTQHAEQLSHFQGYTYAIIRTIANRIAGQPLRVARLNSTEDVRKMRMDGIQFKRAKKKALPNTFKDFSGRAEIIEEHQLVDAFANPNPLMVQWQLIYNLVCTLETTGKAYLWIDDDDDSGPKTPEMWPLPPSWVEPVHTEEKLYSQWKIKPMGVGEAIEVEGKAIVYFYYPDPADPMSALSPLQALAKSVLTDESIEEASRRSFINGVTPGLAIMVGRHPETAGIDNNAAPVLNQEQRHQLITIVKQYYRGVVNNDEPLILDGLIKDVKKITTSPREMDYMNSSNNTKNRLAQGWGVNPISMGEIQGANRASSAVADDHLCLLGDAVILTAKGAVKISDVAIGDSVMTGDGKFDLVEATMCRDYSGQMVRLHVPGLAGDKCATPCHPFWVNRDGELSYINAGDIRRGDKLALPASESDGCDTVNVLDYLDGVSIEGQACSAGYRNARRRLPETLEVTDELAWMLGLYVAEGHSNPTSGICFSVHAGEIDDVSEAVDPILNRLGAPSLKWYSTSENGSQGVTRHKTLSDFLDGACGKGAKQKRVPDFIFRCSRSVRDAFIAGYFWGDGSVNARCVSAVTVSESLAVGIQVLLAMSGYAASVSEYESKAHEIGGRLIAGGRFFNCRVNSGSERLARSIGVDVADRVKRSKPTYLNDGAYVWFPVDAVERFDYEGEVYNLTMKNIHSYVTQFGVSSNCANVVNPRIELISQIMTKFIGPRYASDGEKLLIYIEPAHSVDIDYDLKLEESMVTKGAMGRNEWRHRHGLPPIKIAGGDSTFMGGTEVPIIVDAPMPGSGEDMEDEEDEFEADELEDQQEDEEEEEKRPLTNDPRSFGRSWSKSVGKENVGKIVSDVQTEEEKRIHAEVSKWVARTRAAVLANMREIIGSGATYSQDVVERSADLDAIKKDLLATIGGHITRAATAGAVVEWHLHTPRTSREMKMLKKGFLSNIMGLPTAVANKVSDWAAWMLGMDQWGSIAENIVNDIGEHYQGEIDTGKSAEDALLSTEKAMLSDESIDDRSMAIAATEAVTAVGAGQDMAREVLQKSGVVIRKQWMSMADSKVRDTHRQAHGQIVPVGESFLVGGFTCSFPGDPNLPPGERCGCRCISIGVS